MKITLNGRVLETQQTTLEGLLVEQGYENKSSVATALNGDFVCKDQRNTTALTDNCSIEVVAPMQGG